MAQKEQQGMKEQRKSAKLSLKEKRAQKQEKKASKHY